MLAGRATPFAYPESAARALGRVAARAEWLRRAQGRVPELAGIDRDAARAVVAEIEDRWLTPDEARSLLGAYGLPLVAERRAESVEEALVAAADLGYPVVVKSAVPGAHKTELGAVAVDLRDADAVRAAAERIGARLKHPRGYISWAEQATYYPYRAGRVQATFFFFEVSHLPEVSSLTIAKARGGRIMALQTPS